MLFIFLYQIFMYLKLCTDSTLLSSKDNFHCNVQLSKLFAHSYHHTSLRTAIAHSVP